MFATIMNLFNSIRGMFISLGTTDSERVVHRKHPSADTGFGPVTARPRDMPDALRSRPAADSLDDATGSPRACPVPNGQLGSCLDSPLGPIRRSATVTRDTAAGQLLGSSA